MNRIKEVLKKIWIFLIISVIVIATNIFILNNISNKEKGVRNSFSEVSDNLNKYKTVDSFSTEINKVLENACSDSIQKISSRPDINEKLKFIKDTFKVCVCINNCKGTKHNLDLEKRRSSNSENQDEYTFDMLSGTLDKLEEALNLYPIDVFEKIHIKQIIIYRDDMGEEIIPKQNPINFESGIGGYAEENNLGININIDSYIYDSDFEISKTHSGIIQVAHHEIYHYIDYYYDGVDFEKWLKLNGKNYKYASIKSNQITVIADTISGCANLSIESSETIKGFVSQYAHCYPWEDRAETYKYIMTKELQQDLKNKLKNNDPILKNKVDFILNIIKNLSIKNDFSG